MAWKYAQSQSVQSFFMSLELNYDSFSPLGDSGRHRSPVAVISLQENMSNANFTTIKMRTVTFTRRDTDFTAVKSGQK